MENVFDLDREKLAPCELAYKHGSIPQGELFTRIALFGSQYTVSPAPEIGQGKSDRDFLCYVRANFSHYRSEDNVTAHTVAARLEDRGWRHCLEDDLYDGAGRFVAMRKGLLNVIITDDWAFYDSSIAANEICKAMNIKDRNLRIAIHAAARGEGYAEIRDYLGEVK